MKKSVLIAAGAIAFDLGVMVVAAHAATDAYLKLGGIDKEESKAATNVRIKWYKVKDGKQVGFVESKDACKAAGGTVQPTQLSPGTTPQDACLLPSSAKAGTK